MGVNDPLPENVHTAYNSASSPIIGFQTRRRVAKFIVYSKPSILVIKALRYSLPRPGWTYLLKRLLPVKDSLSESLVYRNEHSSINRPELNKEAIDFLRSISSEDVSNLQRFYADILRPNVVCFQPYHGNINH